MGFWQRWFGSSEKAAEGPDLGRDVAELCRRLAVSEEELRNLRPAYRKFAVPKRGGGTRTILAPEPPLKALQRRILRRLLTRLRSHPAAVGFERGFSIVTNAAPHVGKAVVVRMDLKDFFPSTRADRVEAYFRKIGWNRDVSGLLTRLCTYEGGLPQGAPTSPRLSNLVNIRLDARLETMAARHLAAYTRYADDLTFSFTEETAAAVHGIIRTTQRIVAAEGYGLHLRKKLHIRRRHQAQVVTGLLVNRRINLPRRTRRWLRAVEHHVRTGRDPTLTPAQLAGWHSFVSMIGSITRPNTT